LDSFCGTRVLKKLNTALLENMKMYNVKSIIARDREHDPHNRIKDDVFSMCEKVVTGRLFCRADNRIFLVHCQLILLLENATPGFSSSDDGEKGGEPMLTREGLKRRERERESEEGGSRERGEREREREREREVQGLD